MGWSSAGPIFNEICRELKKGGCTDKARKNILVATINVLQDGDWDTEAESLQQFRDDPVVVEAFKETCPAMFKDQEDDFREFRGRW